MDANPRSVFDRLLPRLFWIRIPFLGIFKQGCGWDARKDSLLTFAAALGLLLSALAMLWTGIVKGVLWPNGLAFVALFLGFYLYFGRLCAPPAFSGSRETIALNDLESETE